MALPKRRHSHQRSRKRRSHQAIKEKALSTCPNCQEPRMPHRACKKCGYYGDRQVINAEEE